MDEPQTHRRSWGLLVGSLIFVGVVTAAVHWPVLSAQALSLDDQEFLVDNTLVQTPSWNSAKRFVSEVLQPSTVRGYYLPLSMISLMLDCGMGGTPHDLHVFHRTSLVLHVLNTLLIVLLLHALFGEPVSAVALGLLFGLHPLVVEPVAWVGERKTLLAAFFSLIGLLCYVRRARGGCRAWPIAAFAAYVLALLSKPTALPLPLVLMLLDYWPLRRPMTIRTAVEKIPFFAAAAVFAAITFLSHERTAGIITEADGGLGRTPLLIGYLMMFYAAKIIWPAGLTSIYTLPKPLSLSNPLFLLTLGGTAVLVAVLIASLRRTRAPLTGGLVFFVAIFPTLGAVQYSWVFASDKYLYLPAVGLLLAAGAGMAWLWSHLGGRPAARAGLLAAVAIAAGLESAGVRHYLRYWSDTLTHAKYLVENAQQSPAAHNHLGQVLAERGQFAQAIPEFNEALRLLPGYSEAEYNLGTALWLQGHIDEAIKLLEQAVPVNPKNAHGQYALGSCLQARGQLERAAACFRRVLELRPQHAAAHNDLGSVLLTQGDPSQAAEQFRQALQIDPHYADAHCNLGLVLARKGLLADAAGEFRQALASNPGHAVSHYNLGLLLDIQGDREAAMAEYEQATAARPDYAEAYNAWGIALSQSGDNRKALDRFLDALRIRPDWMIPLNASAWILATASDPAVRRPDEAIRMAERAAELCSRRNPGVLDTLAAAYASAGQFEKAVGTAEAALVLAEQTHAANQANEIKQHLTQYRRGQAFVDQPATQPASSSSSAQ